MYVRKRRKPVSEINVVPYIDVMLVLLVIFMATATAVMQGVKVDLPKSDAKTIETDEDDMLIVSINAQGQYFLNIGDNPDEELTAVDVATLVQAKLAQTPTIPVVVNGDGRVNYEKVVELMVLLQNAGAPSVGLMTDPNKA
ncbi:protein TolR [Brumicola pallidula]|jgi:biopolymer transport protein TolR|uniref:Tol-Pal system protein TolR n=1 Tax=Brumicola pallidula DSM 14239 = ACAM 615 TaxID=1121922 RepID=K6ZYM6_9ALTE|nr:protein TolR [Glaciecola pallidula]GAC28400.1 biopolymer transport protein TolR [Glaciecola pallidula DSM 14239 = ACAM 615]